MRIFNPKTMKKVAAPAAAKPAAPDKPSAVRALLNKFSDELVERMADGVAATRGVLERLQTKLDKSLGRVEKQVEGVAATAEEIRQEQDVMLELLRQLQAQPKNPNKPMPTEWDFKVTYRPSGGIDRVRAKVIA
jgi:hypothetical protein